MQSGPSPERYAFLRKVGLWTFAGLVAAGVISIGSTALVAPVVFQMGSWAALIVIFGTFALSHWVARKMVYSESTKIPGFVIAIAGEGIALGFLLLVTVLNFGMAQGTGLIVQCMMITAASAGGMLLYVWFSKGEFKWLKALLAMLFMPMLVMMVLQVFWPVGGVIGLIISAVFVVVSAAGLLYRLNYVVHELDTHQHVEGAYEITMGILVLFWNLLQLLNRLKGR
jgi:FtsH-binding integral membrane protein